MSEKIDFKKAEGEKCILPHILDMLDPRMELIYENEDEILRCKVCGFEVDISY